MPELIAKSALEGQAPFTLGGATLAEAAVGPVTSVAVLPGGAKGVAAGLKAQGLTFPAPNASTGQGAVRLVWTGRDQAFLLGIAPPKLDGAVTTDQSDGWAVLDLTGPGAVDVLARLVPLDLRPAAFPVGRVVRSGLNHMSALILRTGDDAFRIMVFRSMARTAWHEIEAAMQMLAARGGR